MTYKGIVKGKSIELEQPLPYEDGQPVEVSIEPVSTKLRRGSAAAILEAIRAAPHLTQEDIDELNRAIEEGKLPVRHEGVFDEE